MIASVFYSMSIWLIIFVLFKTNKHRIAKIVSEYKENKRYKQFDHLLPQAFSIIASCLKAGLPLRKSIQSCVAQISSPMSDELRIVTDEVALGIPLLDALKSLKNRVPTSASQIAFGALILGQELGGNLPDIMQNIANTIKKRESVEGKLNALTAQGRMQSILLCAAPPVIFIGLYFYDPTKIQIMLSSILGVFLLILAVVLEVMGIMITRKVMRLDI